MSDIERALSPSPTRRQSTIHGSNQNLLPTVSFKLSSSPDVRRSQHFTLFLSLASKIREDVLASREPGFSNFIANIRDHDVGLFSLMTEFVGRGATFSVRRTRIEDHRNVVFKSSLPMNTRRREYDEAQRLDFILRELRILTYAPIRDHENIVTLFSVGWEGDASDVFVRWPVLVLEYAELGTLADYFEHEPNAAFNVKLTICSDISAGLQTLHNNGIVHGDLKLENVLVFPASPERSIVAKLSDFGGALLSGDNAEPPTTVTRPWNAPEWQEKQPNILRSKSDVYSLGLLMWRVALDGKDPFESIKSFSLPLFKKERYAAIDEEKKKDQHFLDTVNTSVSDYYDDDERALLASLFGATIRAENGDRSLQTVLKILNLHSSNRSLDEPTFPQISRSKPIEVDLDIREDSRLPFSFSGLEYNGQTAALKPKVLESMAFACGDPDVNRQREAHLALTTLYLSGEDFGFELDVARGLRHLCYAAELGSMEHRAWVLRFHQAFGHRVPERLGSKIIDWLTQATAYGSMTAAEDLVEFEDKDVQSERSRALHALKTTYCGVGAEMFPDNKSGLESLTGVNAENCHEYIRQEMARQSAIGDNASAHLLRLAAAFGSRQGIEYLSNDFSVDPNTTDLAHEFPLLFAARSGHLEALKDLLLLGADPKLRSNTGETALHWLCSFDEGNMEEAARLLISGGALVDAQALQYADESRLPWLESEFVSGTPLHRAVARCSLKAVQVLLDSKANMHAPAMNDVDNTPLALAAKLHYPEILNAFFDRCQANQIKYLVTPSGISILIPAMDGGCLDDMTIARIVRHGRHQYSRAEQTLDILIESGARDHLTRLPGMAYCSAVLYASKSHSFILQILQKYGALKQIDEPGYVDDPGNMYFDDELCSPPLFSAVLYGKHINIRTLLNFKADPCVRMNPKNPITILQACAESGYQDLNQISEFIKRGVKVDEGPPGFATAFCTAVVNRNFVLADFLRDEGADVNALSEQGLMGRSVYPMTILGKVVGENSPGSVSCVEFLFRLRPPFQRVHCVVEPATNHTVFHKIALLFGDSHDKLVTLSTLDLCVKYFEKPISPGTDESTVGAMTEVTHINDRSLSPPDYDKSEAIDRGGNTALHIAVLAANLEVVQYLLMSLRGVDTTIRNSDGMTALEIAKQAYPSFQSQWEPRSVPRHPSRQLSEAQARRNEILELLASNTPQVS